MATIVRNAGFSAEVYPDAKKLGQQLKYADQRGFRIALIAGSQELDAGQVQIKNLATKVSTQITWRDQPDELVDCVRRMLELPDHLA